MSRMRSYALSRGRGAARSLAALALLLASALLLSGCGSSYVLRGRVVQGEFSFIAFVPEGDPRLEAPGISNAEVLVYRDATKMNERVVARGRADGVGNVEIPIAEFGAGWMVEQWRLVVQRARYGSADTITVLPSEKENRRLLVVLAPGFSAPWPDESLIEQYERFK